jgi:hypothetical protein
LYLNHCPLFYWNLKPCLILHNSTYGIVLCISYSGKFKENLKKKIYFIIRSKIKILGVALTFWKWKGQHMFSIYSYLYIFLPVYILTCVYIPTCIYSFLYIFLPVYILTCIYSYLYIFLPVYILTCIYSYLYIFQPV